MQSLRILVLSNSRSSSLYALFSPCNNLTHLVIADSLEHNLLLYGPFQHFFKSVGPNLTHLTIHCLVCGRNPFIVTALPKIVIFGDTFSQQFSKQDVPNRASQTTAVVNQCKLFIDREDTRQRHTQRFRANFVSYRCRLSWIFTLTSMLVGVVRIATNTTGGYQVFT